MNNDKTGCDSHRATRDPDFVNAEIALKRAARKAREIARKTGTTVVIMEDGVIREIRPDDANPID